MTYRRCNEMHFISLRIINKNGKCFIKSSWNPGFLRLGYTRVSLRFFAIEVESLKNFKAVKECWNIRYWSNSALIILMIITEDAHRKKLTRLLKICSPILMNARDITLFYLSVSFLHNASRFRWDVFARISDADVHYNRKREDRIWCGWYPEYVAKFEWIFSGNIIGCHSETL
jgi:hypothetical protein